MELCISPTENHLVDAFGHHAASVMRCISGRYRGRSFRSLHGCSVRDWDLDGGGFVLGFVVLAVLLNADVFVSTWGGCVYLEAFGTARAGASFITRTLKSRV